MFQVIDGYIWYQHRRIARLEPGLNGLLEREITEALEGGIEAAAYDRGFDAGYESAKEEAKEPA
jgi:hypothetical protein